MMRGKKNIQKKNVFIKILLLLGINLSIHTIFLSEVQATTAILPEFSDSYKAWMTLSEEEKENIIEPLPYAITYHTNTQLYRLSRISMFDNLRASYDTTYQLPQLTVKNQEDTGSCWAFSATTILESNFQKIKGMASPLYSPRHMDYTTSKTFLNGQINPFGFKREVGEGGNFSLAMAYCTNGKGAVLESAMPFINNEQKINLSDIEGKDVARYVKAYTEFPGIYKVYQDSNITYQDGYGEPQEDSWVTTIRNKIKNHIIQHGAVSTFTYIGETEDVNQYFNLAKVQSREVQNYAYFCDKTEIDQDAGGVVVPVMPDHQVTIIGWDDTFSKNNFNDAHKPVHDGAWLVQNSWGTGKLNDGLYYISYDDVLVETAVMGIVDSSEKNYDMIYQYDPFGCSNSVTLQNSMTSLPYVSIYGANVFTRTDSQKVEKLSQISFSLQETTKVDIYANPSSGELSDLTFVKSMGTLTPGYYTCDLEDPLTLTGDKFVVAIKYEADGGATLPLELNFLSNGLGSNFWDEAESESGQSYFSATGNNDWEDLTTLQIGVAQTLKDANVCIKAFTTYGDELVIPSESVSSVSLNETEKTMEIGDTFTLIATILPLNATNKNVSWKSSDQRVATVDGGEVRALSAGTTDITVTTEDGQQTATCKVTVNEKVPETTSVSSVTLDATTHSMTVGESFTLQATVLPENATNKNVTWSSSKTDVATVSGEGVVKAISEGETIITVTTQDGSKTADCTVTVSKNTAETTIHVSSISLNRSECTIVKGQTYALQVMISPADATNKNVNWTSSNDRVATVSQSGVVNALSVGTSTITVTTEDGNITASCQVTVKEDTKDDDDPTISPDDDPDIAVESITLNTQGKILHVGDTFTLTAVILPNNATNKEVTWESFDSTIATVDQSGKVRAIDTGITTITARSVADDSVSESCVITVLDKEEDEKRKDEDIVISPSKPSNGDDTIAPDSIPQAGANVMIIIAITILAIIAVIGFIKLHQDHDTK